MPSYQRQRQTLHDAIPRRPVHMHVGAEQFYGTYERTHPVPQAPPGKAVRI